MMGLHMAWPRESPTLVCIRHFCFRSGACCMADVWGVLQAMYKSYGTCRELMELRNLTTVGELILMSALQRKGSCGGHYCLDDPARPVRMPCTTLLYHGLWLKLQYCLDDSVTPASWSHCLCLSPRHQNSSSALGLGAQVRIAGFFWSSKCIAGACAEIIVALWCRQWESQRQPSSAMRQRSSQRGLPSQGVRAALSLGQRFL